LSGVHVRGHRLPVVPALAAERLEGGEERAVQPPAVRERRQTGEVRVERRLAVEAVQRIGQADAARVEADDVEAAVELAVEELSDAEHELHA
jgi:hypothetical protein